MKRYEVVISGSPMRMKPQDAEVPTSVGADARPPMACIRRFPPQLQFLTEAEPRVELQLRAVCDQAHRRGHRTDAICRELFNYSRALGYEATIGVQEVYSSSMPSFPGQTVLSALLMIDLKPLSFPSDRRVPRMQYAAAG